MEQLNNIPDELKNYPNWVCYQLEDIGKPKLNKVPYNPKTGNKASCADPKTWGTFEQVIKAYQTGIYNGIGFEFSKNDPYCGIDLDSCVKDGKILPWAQKIIDQFNSYTEYSPSGTGIHIIIKAKKPGKRCKKGDIEIYDHHRYLTITGLIV